MRVIAAAWRSALCLLVFSPMLIVSLSASAQIAPPSSPSVSREAAQIFDFSPLNAQSPQPLKRKFIGGSVLRPKLKPPPKRQPDFPAFSAAVFAPKFFDAHERLAKPDLSGLTRLFFLTSADFFPFNYRDENGNLAGYNIDLARAVCAELHMENLCRIEALPWDRLLPQLQNSGGDAVLAGLAPTRENRRFLEFSRAYMRFPADFLALREGAIARDSQKFMGLGYDFSKFLEIRAPGLKFGVLKNSAHAQMLENYFFAPALSAETADSAASESAPAPAPPAAAKIRQDSLRAFALPQKAKAHIIAFAAQAEMIKALKTGQIDLAFGDGMRFSLLLNSQNSGAQSAKRADLAFIGQAYIGIGYLGQGMRIAVARNNERLAAAFNYALQQLERKGRLAELYLRYFPIGFY